MPCKVGAAPEYLPGVPSLDVCGLCDRVLKYLFSVVPARANLKNLDALPSDAKADIYFGTKMGWRADTLNVAGQGLLDSFAFELAKCQRDNMKG